MAGSECDVLWDWLVTTDEVVEGIKTTSGFTYQLKKHPDDWYARVHPEDQSRVLSGLTAALKSSKHDWSDEYRYARSDGSYAEVIDRGFIELDEQGNPRRMIGAMFDISVHKCMERRLRESESMFHALFDEAPDALLVTDQAGHIRRINAMALQMFGYERAELLGQPIECLLPKRFRENHVQQRLGYLKKLKRRNMGRIFTLYGRRKDGGEFPVDINLCPIQLSDGLFVVSAIRDMSELMRAQNLLSEADRRKDEFLAMLAHELRNPLAPIRNAVRVLQLSEPSAARLHWASELIDRQVDHLTHLVDDLLDVTRIAQGKIELRMDSLEVETLISRAVEISRPFIDAHHQRLTVSYPLPRLCLKGDLIRLTQVIGNLLNNAAKYTPPGGHIALSVGQEGGHVVFRVKDTGIGIPPDLLPQLFDLFTQGKQSHGRSQDGLGIGLTLVRGLAEMHGGQVEAFSAGPGQGSEFVLRLPVLLAELPEEPAASADPVPRVPAQWRILVVDDNADALDSMAMLLKLGGHEVRTSLDGLEALQVALAFHPQVVLLDISLQGIDGYEVARRLRAQPEVQGLLLIAITGYGQSDDRERSKAAGFDHHLVKPVSWDTLQALLESLQKDAPAQ